MAPSRALITGASSGIGEAFARRLAARGSDVVLVARRADRLEDLARELEGHGQRVEVLAVDLTDPDGVTQVERRLVAADQPVDLLVNNAGFGTTGRFVDLPVERELEMIELNVVALVRLTRAALGPMVARGDGSIVNVSSMAGFQALPRTATYAATKAFVTIFTESVAEEVRGTGVTVQALCPGFTRTEFHGTNNYDVSRVPKVTWQSPDQVVDASLRGIDHRRVVVVPGALNRLTATVSWLTPRSVVRRVAAAVVRR